MNLPVSTAVEHAPTRLLLPVLFAFGALHAFVHVADPLLAGMPWAPTLGWAALRTVGWLLVCAAVLLLYRRAVRPGVWVLLSVALAAPAAALGIELLVAVCFQLTRVQPNAIADLFAGRTPVAPMLPSFMIQAAVLVALGVTSEARARTALLRVEQVRARNREARLQQLRNQLHPHFLFNALHGVAALLRRDPAAARSLLERLQRLYRHSLRSLDEITVPLAQELAWSREYLDIERERFADRLAVRISAPATVGAVPVPPLILQPLVENAVRHGVSTDTGPGWIEISAAADEGELVLRVANAARRRSEVAFGFGLRHTTRRLAETYGAAARLLIEPGEDAIAFVLRLPLAGPATQAA
jgi:sensor histidine kinase YesM